MRIPEARVLVLVDADGGRASYLAGHLFEDFIARLMAKYGYADPTTKDLRTTARGIELDIALRHRMAGHVAFAECKAYSSPVKGEFLLQFYGTLMVERMTDPDAHGFFVALPRLTADGNEKAKQICERDSKFKVLTANDVVQALREQQLILDPPRGDLPSDDYAVVVTEHGVFSCAIELDPVTRTASRILVWSTKPPVPTPVLDLISASPAYGDGITAVDASLPSSGRTSNEFQPDPEPLIATVAGSKSDFEYQLPASPKFFVGRSPVVSELEETISAGSGVIVLNAQSGWGKSSLALRTSALVQEKHLGHALVVDSRTAATRTYITTVLRRAALEAQEAGVLQLPSNVAWATLASALRTLAAATWKPKKRLVIFFDQFENVFKDPGLTREFRDLAVGVRESRGGLVVGFAWKTDLVGWTEGHPYQLRDEIRANARVITLEPLGPREVDTLLRRLEKVLEQKLVPDLKQRLREYSQGLPWLLKKLAGHVIREARMGTTQEKLLAEALNIQNLFEADLAELQPIEQDGLKYIARYAPVAAGEVTERVQASVVQSLLDRRLIVQVGERLDTYWDTFRDFLNTGRVPVEDTYILRLGPRSVARLLAVLPSDGNGSVPEIAESWGTTDKAVFNISRELRLLGVTVYEPNRVRVAEDIWASADREDAIRKRVAKSLRRHRAYTRITQLAERLNGRVSMAAYTRELPSIFPAVSPSLTTWPDHARVFSQWFQYAGLVRMIGQTMEVTPDGESSQGFKLLGARPIVRLARTFPHNSPGPAIQLLRDLALGQVTPRTKRQRSQALRDLVTIGAVIVGDDGSLKVSDGIIDGVEISPSRLRVLLSNPPGCADALALLERDPAAEPLQVGELIRQAYAAEWAPATVISIGKYMRSWARQAGVFTRRRTDSAAKSIEGQPTLDLLA